MPDNGSTTVGVIRESPATSAMRCSAHQRPNIAVRAILVIARNERNASPSHRTPSSFIVVHHRSSAITIDYHRLS
jgi:hypothetical protein